MKINLKLALLLESLIILLLIGVLVRDYAGSKKISISAAAVQSGNNFLSNRIYTKEFQPESFIISDFTPLRDEVQQYLNEKNKNISVYVVNLRNGVSMGINEKNKFWPASLNKMPIAVAVMKKVEKNGFTLDTKLQILESDRDDDFELFYKNNETEATVGDLMEKMLKSSDNTAMRTLVRNIDPYELDLVLDYYGINLTERPTTGYKEYTSPKSMYNIFSSLYLSSVLDKEHSEYILSLLANTILNMNRLAEVPDDVTIVHKFGEKYVDNEQFYHDCGIMYINESRIFYCVMTKDVGQYDAVVIISHIINNVYNYVIGEKKELRKYHSNLI